MPGFIRLLFPTKQHLALLGLCIPQTWMCVVSQGYVCASVEFQLAFHSGMLAALLLLALSHRKLPVAPKHRVDWVAAGAMASLPAAGIIGGPFGTAAETAFGTIAGIGIAWCFARWFATYCRRTVRDATGYILLGFSIGALGCLLLIEAATVTVSLSLLPLSLIPFASPILLSTVGRLDAPADHAPSTESPGEGLLCRRDKAQIAFLVVQVGVYCLLFGNGILFGALQNGIAGLPTMSATLLNYGLRTLFTLLLFVWVALQSQEGRGTVRATFNAVLLLIAFALFIFWFLGGHDRAISYGMLSLARNLVLVLIYLALVKTVKLSRCDPYFAFGVGRGVYELSVVLGMLVYGLLGPSFTAEGLGEGMVYITSLFVFVFLSSCFFATAQGLLEDSGRDGDAVALKQGRGADAPTAETKALSVLREDYALGVREYQILELFYRGHSKRRIADSLGLSENTVRWYLQQLYNKLDVHNRDELFELVDSLKPTG